MIPRSAAAALLWGACLPAGAALPATARAWPDAVASLRAGLPAAARPFLDTAKLVYQEEAVALKALNVVSSGPRADVLQAYGNRVSVRRVERFVRDYREAFSRMQREWRVAPSAVASILYVETLYGTLKLRDYPTLDTLVSLAALSHRGFRAAALPEFFAQAQRQEPAPKWRKRDAWERRLHEIGDFWKKELGEYFRLADDLGWDAARVRSIRGSWAGAIGLSQMLPSTARAKIHAFGRFDPWSWADAILLTGYELHRKGWAEDPQQAVFGYNRVDWYVQAVLGLRRKTAHVDDLGPVEAENRFPSAANDRTVDPQESGDDLE